MFSHVEWELVKLGILIMTVGASLVMIYVSIEALCHCKIDPNSEEGKKENEKVMKRLRVAVDFVFAPTFVLGLIIGLIPFIIRFSEFLTITIKNL